MPLDSDVAILGTGVAPLVAANHLLAQNKTVLLLNPDLDFFLEDSELPLDPLLLETPGPKHLARSSPEEALLHLRPDFPGAIEFWSPQTAPIDSSKGTGFHDQAAPHVRQRGRLWISSFDQDRLWNWEQLENLYVEASDAGFNPQLLEGLTATRRFPGYSASGGNYRGLFIPKLCDVDTLRYRNGLLEFVRERLSPDRTVCAVNQLECMPDGIRFHSKGALQTARLRDGMLVFWTPRLSPWVLSQAKRAEVSPKMPKGMRLWEQWSLESRQFPDPGTVGMFGDMIVWNDFEGTQRNQAALTVLKAGPLVALDGINVPQSGLSWASHESLGGLSHLCHNFLRWDRFSIGGLRPRAIFEWGTDEPWLLSKANPKIQVVPSCDGPLVEVVRNARSASEGLLLESHS